MSSLLYSVFRFHFPLITVAPTKRASPIISSSSTRGRIVDKQRLMNAKLQTSVKCAASHAKWNSQCTHRWNLCLEVRLWFGMVIVAQGRSYSPENGRSSIEGREEPSTININLKKQGFWVLSWQSTKASRDKWSAICCILIIIVSVVQVLIILLSAIFPTS